jgi:hypothetical protein
MEAIQYGDLITADFSENTITLEIKECFIVTAGEFAIIKIDSLAQKTALEEFIKNLK